MTYEEINKSVNIKDVKPGATFKFTNSRPWFDEAGNRHVQREVSVIEITMVTEHMAEYKKIEILNVEDCYKELYSPTLSGGGFSLDERIFADHITKELEAL